MSQTLKFLVGREREGAVNNNKSCYIIKNGVMIIINCGKGVVDALKRTGVMKGVKEVYQIVTHSSKEHLYDLKKFFMVLKANGITPKLVNSVSLDNALIKKMGLVDGDDYQTLEPLKDNCNWVNFLVTPHKDKSMSCPIELNIDGKKIFYGGDCGVIPFSIEGYDEYYFDFAEKSDEFHMDITKIKKLSQKYKIRKSQMWLVHLTNMAALQMAERIGMNVAEEEQAKINNIAKKAEKRASAEQNK